MLLEVRNMRTWYPIRKGLFKRIVGHVKAVDGLSLSIRKGMTLALVGESGAASLRRQVYHKTYNAGRRRDTFIRVVTSLSNEGGRVEAA